MSTNPTKRIEEIDRRLEELPKGTLTYKKIKGKEQPYIQRTIDGKSVSHYVKLTEREKVLMEFEERTKLQEEKKHLRNSAPEHYRNNEVGICCAGF